MSVPLPCPSSSQQGLHVDDNIADQCVDTNSKSDNPKCLDDLHFRVDREFFVREGNFEINIVVLDLSDQLVIISGIFWIPLFDLTGVCVEHCDIDEHRDQ